MDSPYRATARFLVQLSPLALWSGLAVGVLEGAVSLAWYGAFSLNARTLLAASLASLGGHVVAEMTHIIDRENEPSAAGAIRTGLVVWFHGSALLLVMIPVGVFSIGAVFAVTRSLSYTRLSRWWESRTAEILCP